MVKLWEEVAHRYSKAMAHLFHFPFLWVGMIWDHHIVWNNYGNQLPIGIPYQLLKHTSLALPALWK